MKQINRISDSNGTYDFSYDAYLVAALGFCAMNRVR